MSFNSQRPTDKGRQWAALFYSYKGLVYHLDVHVLIRFGSMQVTQLCVMYSVWVIFLFTCLWRPTTLWDPLLDIFVFLACLICISSTSTPNPISQRLGLPTPFDWTDNFRLSYPKDLRFYSPHEAPISFIPKRHPSRWASLGFGPLKKVGHHSMDKNTYFRWKPPQWTTRFGANDKVRIAFQNT